MISVIEISPTCISDRTYGIICKIDAHAHLYFRGWSEQSVEPLALNAQLSALALT